NRTVIFYGLDVVSEHNGRLGWFEYVNNGTTFKKDIPDGYCIITPYIAETLHVDVGDNVTIRYATFPAVNLTVMAVVNQVQKFTFIEIDTIITNLQYAQSLFLLNGKVNYFQMLIKNREFVYDTRNIPESIKRMRHVGEKVQSALGYEYSITMPKLQELENSEMMNVAMSVAFIFITFIAMMISAILINSILSTAVEDRIREFGIFRVLGARRSFSFKLIIYQGLFLSIIASIFGVILGTMFAQLLLPILYNWLGLWTHPIELIVLPQTIALTVSAGIGITLVVTAIPAYKAARKKIIEAINPYRHQKTGWKVKKEGQVNTKLIGSGAAACAVGVFVFYLIPQIAMTGDIFIVMIAFLGVQIAFLIGLAFVSLGFVPGLEKLILFVFRLFNKKTTPIVGTSLYRYRRRNTSTVLMFSMTFAFIMFITTTLSLMFATRTYLIEVNYGSDMVLYSTDVGNQVDEKLMWNITTFEGVEQVSGVYTDALDIAAIQLALSQTGTEDLNVSRVFENNRPDVYLSDLIGYYDFYCALIGIDQNYTKIMNPSMMEVQGANIGDSAVDIVNKLFEPNKSNVIISRSVADYAQFKVGDNVRLSFYSKQGYNLIRLVNATVVGISDGMPGFWQFREARITMMYGGVLCSKENYLRWMNLDKENPPLSKIFIDIDENYNFNYMLNEIKQEFEDTLKDDGNKYDFVVEHQQNRIKQVKEDLETVSLLFQTILSFTILIALFGLMSSIYSTVVERKREIGVLKAIGLRNKQTRNLFIMESVIILLASSFAGSLIGIVSSLINQYENSTLTEVPALVILNPANLPWDVIIESFGIALIVCLVGMIILLRRIEKMEVMEIFRTTM
ncbi:MAG: FtsX-like permease family protein, partial [Promethearchaeota archaeon]